MSPLNDDNNSTPSSPHVTPSTPIIANNPQPDPNGPPTIIALNVGSQITIKLSESSSYTAWRVQFNALLIGHGLKGYVDGTFPCSTKFLHIDASNINLAYNHWIRQDRLIGHALISFIDPTLTIVLGVVQTSKDAWDILSTMYANKSRSKILSLKDKLSHLTKGDQSVSAYLQQINLVSGSWTPVLLIM
ncbi:gag-polypeptide of LTR copia-type [Sesbania bispinosa]|nr:gag-polypeptide of LTR copia-type [Sesbania bispinosa]